MSDTCTGTVFTSVSWKNSDIGLSSPILQESRLKLDYSLGALGFVALNEKKKILDSIGKTHVLSKNLHRECLKPQRSGGEAAEFCEFKAILVHTEFQASLLCLKNKTSKQCILTGTGWYLTIPVISRLGFLGKTEAGVYEFKES